MKPLWWDEKCMTKPQDFKIALKVKRNLRTKILFQTELSSLLLGRAAGGLRPGNPLNWPVMLLKTYMTCLLWRDFQPHFPVRLRGQWSPSEAGHCFRGQLCGAPGVKGLTRLRILSLISESFSFSFPDWPYQEKGPGTPRKKAVAWKSAPLELRSAPRFHLVFPHTRPLTPLNWFLLCHIAITLPVLPSQTGCEFHARCLRESVLNASQIDGRD